ncbi:MAG: OmpA family protein [Candidatus Acidiferrales bacterium]
MKKRPKQQMGWVIALLFWAFVPGAWAQTQPPAPVREQVTATRPALVLTYPEGSTVTLKLNGTSRLPKANGEAKVQRKKGATEIEVELDEMKPAHLFGGDFNTYVLWAVSPEGQVNNLGEFILQGNRSKLNVTTPLQTFGLFITAEPHFLVQYPSRFLVLENTRPVGQQADLVRTSQIEYRGYLGVYEFDRDSLATAPEAKSEVRTELRQARTAIQLAERAQAQQYALEKLTQARVSLQQAEQLVQSRATRTTIANMEKAAIRAAYEAQLQAEEGAIRAAAEAERKAREEQEARLRQEAQRAELAKAEEARRRAEAEAARARAQAEEERARREAEEARRMEQGAREKAEAARREEEEARRKEVEARLAAERAEQEKQALRAKLLDQFNRILPTQDTPRGLLVTMADVLFDFGKFDLRPGAREALAKLSGIVLAHPGLELDIEGHTDSVGSEEVNQRLSEKRAEAVRDYLIQQGLDAGSLRSRGHGKGMPVASNDTAAGRQQNRRVEMIVSGEVIGTKIGATPR